MSNNALVTGANGSLGTAIVNRFKYSHNKVVGMPKGLRRKEMIFDWLDERKMETPFSTVILNDGINHLSWIGETPAADEAIIDVNLMSAYWTLDWLVANNNAAANVIFITSQTYRVPQRTTSLYCASKAALTQLMKTAARELAPKGWVINAIAPGKIIDTEMSQLTDDQVLELRGWTIADADEYAKKLIPAGRYTYCGEVADAVQWLLGAPTYINGAVIEMMGAV